MPSSLITTVIDIQPTHVVVRTSDGQEWTLPHENILGKPQLNQPLFINAACPGSEAGSSHALAQTIVEHLLES